MRIHILLQVIALFIVLNTNAQFIEYSLTRNQESIVTHIVDIDMDGDKDIINDNAWIENIGNNQFIGTPHILVPSEYNITSICSADFDKDGDIDICFGGYNNIIYVENKGNNDYEYYEIDGYNNELDLTSSISNIQAIDMNNDDTIDIVFRDSKGLYWMQYADSLKFNIKHTIATGSFSGLKIADVNNDSLIDAISLDVNEFYWYENKNSDSLFMPHLVGEVGYSMQIPKIAFEDFDGDSIKDILSCSVINDKIFVYNGNSDFTFNPMVSLWGGASYLNYIECEVYDYDKDNDMDIVVVTSSDVLLFKNNGNGRVESPMIIIDAYYGKGIEADDFNNNGTVDILLKQSGTDNQDLILYSNNPDTFTPTYITTEASNSSDIMTFDYDNDGDLDIVSSAHDRDAIFLYVNTGNGIFHSPQLIGERKCQVLEHMDIDNDGYQDVLCGTHYEQYIGWFRNNTKGSFDEVQEIETSAYASNLVVGHIDNDSLLDIVHTNQVWAGDIMWSKNIGDGTFTTELMYIDTRDDQIAYDTKIIDFDNDGDNDIIASWSDVNDIVWYTSIRKFSAN